MAYPKPEKTLFQTDLTETATTDIEGAGAVRKDVDGNVYRWVLNSHSAALTVGNVPNYDGADRTQVILPVTTAAKGGIYNTAGAVMASSLASGSYGWIQCKGAATVSVKQDSIALTVLSHRLAPQADAAVLIAGAAVAASAANGIQPAFPMTSLASTGTAATTNIAATIDFRM